MKATASPPGDKATVTVLVAVDPAVAFEVFTEEIDLWWKRGPAYRVAGRSPGVLTFEPGVGGRLFERFDERLVEMGRIVEWDPPRRLAFEWRGVNFSPGEKTDVTVTFEPSPSGTRVTVEHRGFASLRPDHPVRHGKEPAAFIGGMGRWWGELMTSLREHALSRDEASDASEVKS